MTLKRENNSNAKSVTKLVENEVLHQILVLLCQKVEAEAFWILASILDFRVKWKEPMSEIDSCMLVDICANVVFFHQKFLYRYAMPPY